MNQYTKQPYLHPLPYSSGLVCLHLSKDRPTSRPRLCQDLSGANLKHPVWSHQWSELGLTLQPPAEETRIQLPVLFPPITATAVHVH